jgi:hypothetical protein
MNGAQLPGRKLPVDESGITIAALESALYCRPVLSINTFPFSQSTPPVSWLTFATCSPIIRYSPWLGVTNPADIGIAGVVLTLMTVNWNPPSVPSWFTTGGCWMLVAGVCDVLVADVPSFGGGIGPHPATLITPAAAANIGLAVVRNPASSFWIIKKRFLAQSPVMTTRLSTVSGAWKLVILP